MMKRTIALTLVVAAATTVPAWAGGKGLHIPAGRPTNWAWVRNDGAGYRWDIQAYGYVSSGTSSAYSTGMQLRVNNSYYSWSSQGNLSKDGSEVQTGPWGHGSIRVWRRVYVDPKLGYCRWIDIFENTSGTKQALNIEYRSRMGSTIGTAVTTSGKPSVDKKDWGVITATSTSSRPAVVHVFAGKNAKVRPTVQYSLGSSNSFQYRLALQIGPKETLALCLFEAQRRPYAKAVEFLKQFRPGAELRKVPAALRRIIINMRGVMLALGNLELPRDEKRDQVILTNGDQLLGEIFNEKFIIDTSLYGKVELPAKRVVGLSVPSTSDPHILIGLVDGQVLAGKFVNGPLKFTLVDGNQMTLKLSEIETAAYRLSTDRPDQIKLTKAMVVLRDGQRLIFGESDADYTFYTEHGEPKLDPGDLRAIELDTPAGGLHRAIFRNESVLSGLMVTKDLKLKLDLGPELKVKRHMVRQFMFPVADEEKDPALSRATLRNDDELFGKIAEKSLEVEKGPRRITVDPATIAEISTIEGAVGRVRIKQHNGTIVTGRLVQDAIRFQITPGPLLKLFVGHITSITCPKPPAPPKEPPKAPKPAPKPNAGAAPVPPEAAKLIKEVKISIAEIQVKMHACRDAILAAQAKRNVLRALLKESIKASDPKERIAKLQQQLIQFEAELTDRDQEMRNLTKQGNSLVKKLAVISSKGR